jgi:hypothetical protein
MSRRSRTDERRIASISARWAATDQLFTKESDCNAAISRSTILLHIKENLSDMPKFVIEREIPGAGQLSPEQLQAVSQKSCSVLRELGPQIQWLQSYVTDDKIYCIYIAPDEETVRRHAQMGGFPANRVSAVRSIIDPTTSE